jgi:ribosomal protein S18 acetylase RimI-like enzyme
MRMISLIALGVAGPARHHLIDRRLVFFILVTSPASQTKARFCKDIPVGHPTDMDETPAMRTGTIRKLLTTEESLFRNHLLRPRAAGELHAPDDDLTSDIAFSVEPEFRNRGIGTAMLRRLILSARNRKIQHLRIMLIRFRHTALDVVVMPTPECSVR